jgi:hypothetical protein
MNEKEMTGHVICYMKGIEYTLNCIIENYFLPQKNTGFFSNILLNPSVTSTGAKIKVIEMICKKEGIKYNFNNLRKLIDIRNVFAHESSFVDAEEGEYLLIDEFKNNGKYTTYKLEDLFKKFKEIYKSENQAISKLNERISNH